MSKYCFLIGQQGFVDSLVVHRVAAEVLNGGQIHKGLTGWSCGEVMTKAKPKVKIIISTSL